MKPANLDTKIFLDSGDPQETTQALEMLGFLDGQTTNPSLIAKNPEAQQRLEQGNKFTSEEVNTFYENVVREVSVLIPEGSVSIEVYADENTSADAMTTQAKEMNQWIPNAHIKLPITKEGLKAAEILTKEGMRVNMTLCFSQQQAAAVHVATRGAKRGSVFLSPFIGRLDDTGIRGLDLVKNCNDMYSHSISHVEVLGASIRSLDHLLHAFKTETDIVTVPFTVLQEWNEAGMPLEPQTEADSSLKEIPYKQINISQEKWSAFNIQHDLTDKGLKKFTEDWNNMIAT